MAPFFLALLHGFPLNAVQQIGVGGHRPVAAVHHHLQCVAFFPQLFHCLTNLSGHLLRTLILPRQYMHNKENAVTMRLSAH